MQAKILDQKLKGLVTSERKITYEILLLIQTLDVNKAYRELGFSSLHEYLTKEIGYSEGAAHRRISSARLMKQVPDLEDTIKNGNLNLTQISLAQVAIRQQEKAIGCKVQMELKTEVLEKLKTKSSFETQKILKENFPHFEIPKPRATPTIDTAGNSKVCVTLEFSENSWEKIQSLLAHFSHSVPDQKIESLLLYWFNQVQAKRQKQKDRATKTTVQKIAIASTSNAISSPSTAIATTSPTIESTSTAEVGKKPLTVPAAKVAIHRRKKSPVKVQIELRETAKDQCEYRSALTGRRCSSKHFLEEEHKVPLSRGGTNTPGNLRIFCRSHNQLMAKLWGISKI